MESSSAGLGGGPVGLEQGAHSEGGVGLQVPHVQLARGFIAVTHHIPVPAKDAGA